MTVMKQKGKLFAALSCCMFLMLPSIASADFANPGFETERVEDPDVADPTKAESWTSFSGGGDTADRSDEMPRTGDWGFLMQMRSDIAGFGGAFQSFAVSPGDPVEFSAWAKVDDLADGTAGVDDEGDPATQMRMRFEWRSGGSEIAPERKTLNITGSVTDVYQLFTLNDIAPAGADEVRAVFALNRNDDKFYFDDVSFAIVPEPASMGLALIAGLGMLSGRRRRS